MRSAFISIAFYAASSFAQAPDSVPSANPGRPTITSPATLAPLGYLQFEQGYTGSLDSPETASQYGLNQTLKLTVHPRLMLEVTSQPFAVSHAPGSSRDAGDLLVGGQAILYTPPDPTDTAAEADVHRHAYVRSALPTVSVAILDRIHSGSSADIDLGSNSRSALLLFSGHAPGLDVHYDINFIAAEQSGDSLLHPGASIRRAQFGQTFAIDRSYFNPRLQFSFEVYRFSQPTLHQHANGTPVARANLVGLLIATSYQLRPNLVLDCGFEHGLTSTSTQWQSFAGFTYVLPQRLWPQKHLN